jgi:hypothetical protein
MDFALFILLNAVLFIRPAEIVPALLGLPLYEVLSLTCLAVAAPRVLGQLQPRSLVRQPITACAVGLLGAILLSHLSHLYIWGARTTALEFFKVLLYYLLLVAIVNTTSRLRRLVYWLILFIAVLAVVAVAQYHGLVNIPSLTTLEQNEEDPVTGQMIVIPRLRSTGIYNDPNDLGLILVVGVLLTLYGLFDREAGAARFGLAAPLGLFLYALVLTKSRGQFLALMAGVAVLFQARYGWRKTLLLGGTVLPVLAVLFAGRQTSLSTSHGTSQERIRLWSQGLDLLRGSPLFGIGAGEYAERAGLVAHNSFLHCFTELGLLGGPLFLGAFFCAGRGLWGLNARRRRLGSLRLQRLCPCLTATVFAYAVGLLSLSRPYSAPTYAVLGLAVACLSLARPAGAAPRLRLDGLLLRRLAFASASYLVGIYCFVRAFARWGA